MTSKEASEVLKASSIQQMSFCKVVVNGKAFNVKEALDMAIKSLEAWESLTEELKYELCKKVHEKDSCIPCPNQTTSCSYTGLRIYELNNIINHVINKHLSEVSE